MSVRVMSWVWEHSQSKGMDRLVLLAVADCAADDGGNAFPSMAKLVAKTGLTDRGIQKCMARLVESGELAVYRNAGPRGCNRYRVRMRTPEPGSPPPNDVHPEQDSPRTTCTPNHVRETPEPRSPGTVLEPSVKTSSSKKSSSAREKRGTRIPDDFAVTPEMTAWAREHVPQLAGKRETEKFIDHWRSADGRNAVKRDWAAAWRNWMRGAVDRYGPAPGNALAVRNGHTAAKPSTSDQRAAAAKAAGREVQAMLDGRSA